VRRFEMDDLVDTTKKAFYVCDWSIADKDTDYMPLLIKKQY